jgi:hypothetical protein
MQKFKTFIIVPTLILMALVLTRTKASAAEVTKVIVRHGHVYIDQGKPGGFVFGAEVCFYSDSGEKITCGRVRQTTDVYAMVQVDNRAAKLIKKGTRATLSTGDTTEKEGG